MASLSARVTQEQEGPHQSPGSARASAQLRRPRGPDPPGLPECRPGATTLWKRRPSGPSRKPGSLPVARALAAGREEHQAAPASQAEHSSAFREASPGHSETHFVQSLTGTRAPRKSPEEPLIAARNWGPNRDRALQRPPPHGLAGLSCPPCVHPRTPHRASPGVACSCESTKQTEKTRTPSVETESGCSGPRRAPAARGATVTFQGSPSSPATSLKIHATSESRRGRAGSGERGALSAVHREDAGATPLQHPES